MIGALLVAGARPTVGPNAGPWAIVAERVSRLARGPLTYDLRSCSRCCVNTRTLYKGRIGGVWNCRSTAVGSCLDDAGAGFLVSHSRTPVCVPNVPKRSYASGRLLRRGLESRHMQQFAFEELPWIAREADHVLESDPAFVEDLYRAAFTFNDQSDDRPLLARVESWH